jgi:hypothetical protein
MFNTENVSRALEILNDRGVNEADALAIGEAELVKERAKAESKEANKIIRSLLPHYPADLFQAALDQLLDNGTPVPGIGTDFVLTDAQQAEMKSVEEERVDNLNRDRDSILGAIFDDKELKFRKYRMTDTTRSTTVSMTLRKDKGRKVNKTNELAREVARSLKS